MPRVIRCRERYKGRMAHHDLKTAQVSYRLPRHRTKSRYSSASMRLRSITTQQLGATMRRTTSKSRRPDAGLRRFIARMRQTIAKAARPRCLAADRAGRTDHRRSTLHRPARRLRPFGGCSRRFSGRTTLSSLLSRYLSFSMRRSLGVSRHLNPKLRHRNVTTSRREGRLRRFSSPVPRAAASTCRPRPTSWASTAAGPG